MTAAAGRERVPRYTVKLMYHAIKLQGQYRVRAVVSRSAGSNLVIRYVEQQNSRGELSAMTSVMSNRIAVC